mmetsp:Transcript_84739/g.265086  ORF Transcript_84739/g.265086 Transcript_84739/m.265086 type:complete len:833 (+) Transcript_84739:55-2553(+)
MVPASAPGGLVQANGSVSSELRRVFLELGPEERRQFRAAELLQQSTASDAADCISFILDRLVNFASAQSLGLYALYTLLRLHTAVVIQNLTSSRVYDLFNPNADERPPAMFLHAFVCCKESQGLSAAEEGTKFQRLLLRRSKQPDLRRLAATPARAWLSRIWQDAPSTCPDARLIAGCCARWIGDTNACLDDKLPCLELMRRERERRGLPEGDAWTVSVVLEQVCRDPMGHSPDLQHLLWPLGGMLTPSLLKPLLHNLAQDHSRLVTLWVCLCLWSPQPQPQGCGTAAWSQGALPPAHTLVRALLAAFSQLANSSSLCRTCLLTLAAIASSGGGEVAAAAPELLLMLHRDGPPLPADVWLPVVPMLEGVLAGQSAAAVELLARFQRAAGVPQPLPAGPPTPAYPAAELMVPFTTPPPVAMLQHQPPQCGFPAAGAFATANGVHATAAPDGGGLVPPAAFGPGDFSTAPPAVGGGPKLDEGNGVLVEYVPPRVGLQNANETCYMNSFIQSLFLTNRFVWRIFSFELHLKKNPSKVDKEDFETGLKITSMLQKQIAKMALTRYKHTDILELLKVFPEIYRSGEQQDVTETIRFVFDMLGGYEQPLIREVFAGELSEKTVCQVCGTVKSRPETFSDLVLPVPKENEVMRTGAMPTTQALLDERLKFEYLDEDNLVFCESCQQSRRVGKWCEIVSPPAHLCICLSRFAYDPEQGATAKEKTPVQINGTLQIGPFTYELYHVIIHTGKTATSGHYYAIGKRSEPTPDNANHWVTMDDSQIKDADMSLLTGGFSEKQKDDNPYVLFYRCQQAPPTPPMRVPVGLHSTVSQEEANRQDS